jgi:hypothetical protein
MRPRAVAARLRRGSQLRRLCLSLALAGKRARENVRQAKPEPDREAGQAR